ncbi:MAG TPA: hypothetical protein VFU66_10755 [Edaphobacter sp.]|nr:hypothetical protein [Edaphobacter sp.]
MLLGAGRNTGVSPLRRQKAPSSVEMTWWSGVQNAMPSVEMTWWSGVQNAMSSVEMTWWSGVQNAMPSVEMTGVGWRAVGGTLA